MPSFFCVLKIVFTNNTEVDEVLMSYSNCSVLLVNPMGIIALVSVF